MKTIPASPTLVAFRSDIALVLKKHGEHLTALEMLALTAHLTGQLVALQDQRLVSPAMAMELVAENIELGNREIVNGLLGPTVGNA